MNTPIPQLVQAANQAATAGRFEEAERLWREVRRQDPSHPKALFSLGFHALQRGDVGGAIELLRAARGVAPGDLVVLLTLAAALRQARDPEGEYEAVQAALAQDAYFVPALIAKASWIERNGTAAAAARMYENALKVAPAPSQWPANLRPSLEHAQRIVERNRGKFDAFLDERLADQRARLPAEVRARWQEAVSIMSGRTRPYHQECNEIHVPRLPEIPFHERSEFPWLASIEAKTDVIRAELLAALEADRDKFSPYIQYQPGDPVNQWQELNHSLRWSVFSLWAGGKPVPENIERCPETARAVSELPLVDIEGLCPNVMFSALAPRTRIPPHNGETNARLVAHLPLIVPPRCVMRVGHERREWKVGEVLILDDTIEHEAINDSDELRVVLMFDLWNPRLGPEERDMVRAMTAAARAYEG
jgi:aspartyl/asparaginyl beta-hydroxylase (cupin superfamily)